MITQLKEKKNIIFLIINLVLLLLGLLYLRDTVSPYKTIFLVSYISVFVGIILLVLFRVRAKIIMSLMLVLFAAAFFLATPNGSMHDEEAHFYRAFQISEGHLISPDFDGLGGDMFPAGISDFNDNSAELDYSDQEQVLFPTSAIYSPQAYVPQAAAIRIARFFTRNVSVIFTCGRIGVLLLCLFLLLWAVKIMPFAHELLFLVIMFPMTLQELVSMSADGLTISLALLFTAYILKLSYSDKAISVRDIVILFILGTWVSVIKIFYVPITLLILIIPKEKFSGKRGAVTFKIIFIAVSVLMTAAWMLMASPLASAGQRGDIMGQAGYLLTHVQTFFAAMIRTIHWSLDNFVSTMIGSKLGKQSVAVNPLMWVSYLILLACQTATCKSVPEKKHRSDIPVFLIAFSLATIMVFIGLYLQWTSVIGNAYVEGIQGRYFTPVILLLLLVFAYNRGQGKPFSGTYYYVLIAFFDSLALLDLMRAYA